MPFQTDQLPTPPVAIVSDIHANAAAFGAAIRQLHNLRNTRGVQNIVVLGDLFTYGCGPRRVVEQLLELADDFDVWLVIGNHDEWYFDALADDDDDPTADKPGWIRECIHWTRRRLDATGFDQVDDRRLWHRELVLGDVLLSHANPFGAGDWTYLNDEATRRKACEVLAERQLRAGIFGHTHRRLAAHIGEESHLESFDDLVAPHREFTLQSPTWLLNPGSVGQPREQRPMATFMILWGDRRRLTADFRAIEVGVDEQIDAVRRADLTAGTKQRLIGYITGS